MPEKHKFNEHVEKIVTSQIVDSEYMIAKAGKSMETIDFESALDMLELKRNEKDYEWMSDISLGELAAILLTEASDWSNQYFQSRDFVEAKLDGAGPDDMRKCKAAKRCINSTLNRRELYHYHKYIRGRTINALAGQVYKVFWWEKDVKNNLTGYQPKYEQLDIDIDGNPIVDPENQIPQVNQVQGEPIYQKQILKDHINYDVVDPRNVFTDSTYCYSIQDKAWITLRRESTYEKLKKLEAKNNYFNLDLVKELTSKKIIETDTSRETYAKDEEKKEDKPITSKFDVLLRFGQMWAKVKTRKEDGYPDEIEPGYNQSGEVLKGAELIDTLSETVYVGSHKILIRFQPVPFRDSRGNPYRPISRGWCYIHPTKDIGLSDGKYLREINIAMDDAYNMAADRTKISTLPTLKVAEPTLSNDAFRSTIFFAPEHIMEEQNKDDIQEFKIDGNVDGSMNLFALAQKQGNKLVAVYPTTQGELPQTASTTATAVAGAESRGNLRANYKSLTYEYTDLQDTYWIILQMTYQFAEVETALKMMGDDAEFFDPDADYTYSPVSSNIEMEYNKRNKIQGYDQAIGRLGGLVPVLPKLVPIIAHMIKRTLELQGDEFQDIGRMIEELSGSQPVPQGKEGQAGAGTQTPADMGNVPTSNQTGNPMTSQEEFARNNMMMQGMRGES